VKGKEEGTCWLDKEKKTQDDGPLNQALKEKKKSENLTNNNIILKHEMESMMMRLTKEIEENKKKEENLNQTLKETSDECYILDCESNQLKSKL
jgi:predicted RNase H-like nuclease (RuvC/YqgF family)